MRRFIAGAVCPQCRSVDRLVVEDVPEGRRRRCVQCGYADLQDGRAVTAPATRFDGAAAAEARPVRLITPGDPPPWDTAPDPEAHSKERP